MPFKFLEGLTVADVAFQATGRSLAELFVSSAKATESVMAKLETINPRLSRTIRLSRPSLEELLYAFLNELVFLKDSKGLLFSKFRVKVKEKKGTWALEATAKGERLDPQRHVLLMDVKAATMHKFELKRTRAGWRAQVVLDV
ncbi:MAG: archease [Candidatus Micrarchaeia archaeon]